MIKTIFACFLLFYSVNLCQEISNISVTKSSSDYLLQSYNYEGSIYISLQGISKILGYRFSYDEAGKKITIDFPFYRLDAVVNTPYLIIESKTTGKSETVQLPTSVHLVNDEIFIPFNSSLDLINSLSESKIVVISPNKLFVTGNLAAEKNKIWKVELENDSLSSFLKIDMLKWARYSIARHGDNEFDVLLRNAELIPEIEKSIQLNNIVQDIDLQKNGDDVIVKLKLNPANVAYEIVESKNNNEIILHFFEREESGWYEKESEHFRIIYRESHAHLVNHILACAENSLKRLSSIFAYTPTEKIVINTYDVSDYGFGATTTVPQNYIRLEIESFEPGYEAVPYNERMQWLLSHELVHIVVNDQASDLESAMRTVFRKVPPEKSQPFTTIYSILTNYSRYTPRWYQEGIAVFMETWLSGGYGRTLGNFDEMYFRSLTYEGKDFPTVGDIETKLSHNSIFLENTFYFYGTRFVSYLAVHYGVDKVINWFKTFPYDNLTGYIGKFHRVFNEDFDDVWEKFGKEEKEFQDKNIGLIMTAPVTEQRRLSSTNFGWVTQPYFDAKTLSVIYGYHKSAHLGTLQKFHLLTGNSEVLSSLPTPSIYQVASIAFDESNNLLFYTTNNNRLFRDVWVIDLFTKDEKKIFPDSRVGNITVSPRTHDLWGIQQQGGLSTLVISAYPYHTIDPVFAFDFGDELSDLSVSKSGGKLAAVLHRSSGQQSIIIFDARNLLSGEPVSFKTITSEGSPENPSWSSDENTLYWNAYTNGVSNIYRYDFESSATTAITNCITGLFKPIEISPDSLFVFEFTTDGFVPDMIANKSAQYLPAINYYGQKIVDQDPKVIDWALKNAAEVVDESKFTNEESYNGLSNLHLHSLVPVISGFQNQIVVGIFSHISDPLLLHDFTIEMGVSPFNETPSYPFFHLQLKYDYLQRFSIEYAYNGPDFFDIFNSRKRGMIGSRFKLGYSYYWLYGQPHSIKQETSLSFFRGVEYINDNLTRVSQPDFGVLVSNITSKNLRRTIGSSDWENGNQISLTFTLYGTEFQKKVETLLNGYLEYDQYALWIANHNVLHLGASGGYLLDNEQAIQGRFYFGGFGNRPVDNGIIRQYRKVFRYPGLPIYNLMTTKFFKFMFENAFPPVRVSGWEFADQFINHFDFSLYSQSLITNSDVGNYWVNLGAQMDIKIKHWANLESTFSAGIAKAWSEKMTDWQWFLSIKLLKD